MTDTFEENCRNPKKVNLLIGVTSEFDFEDNKKFKTGGLPNLFWVRRQYPMIYVTEKN